MHEQVQDCAILPILIYIPTSRRWLTLLATKELQRGLSDTTNSTTADHIGLDKLTRVHGRRKRSGNCLGLTSLP